MAKRQDRGYDRSVPPGRGLAVRPDDARLDGDAKTSHWTTRAETTCPATCGGEGRARGQLDRVGVGARTHRVGRGRCTERRESGQPRSRPGRALSDRRLHLLAARSAALDPGLVPGRDVLLEDVAELRLRPRPGMARVRLPAASPVAARALDCLAFRLRA